MDFPATPGDLDPPEEPDDQGFERKKHSSEKKDDGQRPKKDRPIYPGHEFLAFDSPREALRQITEDDPLDIAQACDSRLEERCLLLDEYRLTVRSMARIAYRAPSYLGKPALTPWMGAIIDKAIDELLVEDREEERDGVPPTEPWDNRYSFLGEVLGIEMGLTRSVCIVYNDMSDEFRKVFYNLVFRGKTLNRFVAEGNGPPDKVMRLLHEAMRTMAKPFKGHLRSEDWWKGEE